MMASPLRGALLVLVFVCRGPAMLGAASCVSGFPSFVNWLFYNGLFCLLYQLFHVYRRTLRIYRSGSARNLPKEGIAVVVMLPRKPTGVVGQQRVFAVLAFELGGREALLAVRGHACVGQHS